MSRPTQHHYDFPIQPIDFIIANELGFCEGNIIKYVMRYKRKNGVEDLRKASQYIDFLIEEMTNEKQDDDPVDNGYINLAVSDVPSWFTHKGWNPT